jgi:hypothetical protein
MTVLRAAAILVPVALLMGGIQAGLVVGLRVLKARDTAWPMTLMAALSAALLALGVLRHYWDIWVHRTVRGISFIFVGIDAAGDLFSLVSVFFQPKLDVLGMVIYGTELILWCGVFACGGYYNFLPWARKKWSAELARLNESPTRREAGRAPYPNDIALHDAPSSTSVFSTAPGGGDSGARLRTSRPEATQAA